MREIGIVAGLFQAIHNIFTKAFIVFDNQNTHNAVIEPFCKKEKGEKPIEGVASLPHLSGQRAVFHARRYLIVGTAT